MSKAKVRYRWKSDRRSFDMAGMAGGIARPGVLEAKDGAWALPSELMAMDASAQRFLDFAGEVYARDASGADMPALVEEWRRREATFRSQENPAPAGEEG